MRWRTWTVYHSAKMARVKNDTECVNGDTVARPFPINPIGLLPLLSVLKTFYVRCFLFDSLFCIRIFSSEPDNVETWRIER